MSLNDCPAPGIDALDTHGPVNGSGALVVEHHVVLLETVGHDGLGPHHMLHAGKIDFRGFQGPRNWCKEKQG
jgi:hypothetical protein